MKNKLGFIIKNWYIATIVVMFVAISLLSWAYSVRPMGRYMLSEMSDYNADAAGDNKESVFSIVDREIRNLNDKWQIYKKKAIKKIDVYYTYVVTGEVASVQVLLGKNNWLFYKSNVDSDPIADYEGSNMYSSEQLDSMAQSTMEVQGKLENMGIRFALILPPNKETVYFENMPENYFHCENTRTDILVKTLQEQGVNAISPKNRLLDEHMNYQLYYKYDTHWNQLGAYIGVKDVLSTWNIDIPELLERDVSENPLKGNYHYCGEDDLARLADLLPVFDDEIEYFVEGTIPVDWEDFGDEQEHKIISHIYNKNAPNIGRLLLVGDSFRTSMVPALSEVFSDVYVVHRNNYTPDIMESIKPGYLIVEYVERYSDSIKDISFLVEEDLNCMQ
ncbi:MAG: hypothetical protein HUJ72_08690 [Blautia sp.]|nr:hypothetical protein [Blautia sp.]